MVCAWANTPRCLLLSSHFSPKGKLRIKLAAAVSARVCARGREGEVDLCGLYISSRESPPANLPPEALGPRPHHHYSLRNPRQRRSPPATSPHINCNEDNRRRRRRRGRLWLCATATPLPFSSPIPYLPRSLATGARRSPSRCRIASVPTA